MPCTPLFLLGYVPRHFSLFLHTYSANSCPTSALRWAPTQRPCSDARSMRNNTCLCHAQDGTQCVMSLDAMSISVCAGPEFHHVPDVYESHFVEDGCVGPHLVRG